MWQSSSQPDQTQKQPIKKVENRMRKWNFFCFIACLCVSLQANAKEFYCKKYAHLPVIVNGCQGEQGCGVMSYEKTILPVNIYQRPFKNSKIVARLSRCSVIREPEPYLVIKKLGRVLVTNPGKILTKFGVKAGDVLPFTQYLSDVLEVCIGDQLIEVDLFDPRMMGPSIMGYVKMLEKSVTSAWVRFKTPQGVVGYVPDILEDGKVDNAWYMDMHSYDSEKLCPVAITKERKSSKEAPRRAS